MAQNGKLRLSLVNVNKEALKEKVDIRLRHQTLDDNRLIRGINAAKKLLIENLHAIPQGLYRIEIDPPSYLPVSQFINIRSSGFTELEIKFPVDPDKVVRVEFPKYESLSDDLRKLLENSNDVLAFGGKSGKDLYDALDDVRKAGLLNIAAKSQATLLTNGRNVLSYINRLKELRGDRFFAVVPKELREETKNSIAARLFHEVSGLLHHPPDGYSSAGSFKTEDHYGNLQLSFFMNPSGDCVADIDIDDAAGLAHVFQVMRNRIKDRPTHPFDIHEILISHQSIDPNYDFILA